MLPALFYSAGAFANDKEYKLKAGFLYNFARFGQWQETLQQNENFNLCSFNVDFVDVAKSTLTGRSVKKLPIVISHVSFDEGSLESCDMLFVTADTADVWQNVEVDSLHNIMLVGEADSFIQNGGQIRFFLSGGKIRFEISPQRLSDAGIVISSKVLRLARIIEDEQ
jgi:hypothetical protein